jgi:O-antigen/teichoic acid export membrane protein
MGSDKLIVIIVGVLGGPAVTAYYKVAAQVGASVMLFSDPFYVVIYPWLSRRAARKEWTGMYADMRRLHRVTLAVALPVALLASGLMIPLIPAVFGKELSAAVVPAVIILWGILPDAVYFWVGAVLACIDQVGRLVRYRAIASSLQLVVALVLIPFIGVIGAAVSVLVMHWLYTGLRLKLNESCRRRLIGEEVMP